MWESAVVEGIRAQNRRWRYGGVAARMYGRMGARTHGHTDAQRKVNIYGAALSLLSQRSGH
ncbi:MAG: hypothetical protein HDR09_21990 [Lachnospiraceae bacterium]|nr:hypothetical protein [Lachnospiraceae bacterium]